MAGAASTRCSGISRVAVTSDWDDTVMGSAADEVFLSASQWLEAASTAAAARTSTAMSAPAPLLSITLAEEIDGLFRAAGACA